MDRRGLLAMGAGLAMLPAAARAAEPWDAVVDPRTGTLGAALERAKAANGAPFRILLREGMFVEKFAVKNGALVCQAGSSAASAAVPVADGVRDILFEFGVGKGTDSLAERRVESFKTTAPAADDAIRSLRYAVLLASSAQGLTAGMESSVCGRWAQLGGTAASCDTSRGQLYQLASGSLTLRNLMP